MYRPFKEFINVQFTDGCQYRDPSYKSIKSLARGGGVTLRKRDKSSPSYFLILQHVADRDMVSLTAGWALGAWFADWDAAETAYFGKLSSEQRYDYDVKLQTSPDLLTAENPEGTFIPAQLDTDIVMHELEVGDGGVLYELIASKDLGNPDIRSRVETFLGNAITKSLVEGCVPPMAPANPAVGLHASYRVTAKLLSWECWFEHVLGRKPNEVELEELCGPTIVELSRQVGLVSGVLSHMEAAIQKKSAIK
jgi:hypothetical protein